MRYLHHGIRVLIFCGAILVSDCTMLPQDQRAYNVCVDSYNSEFRSLPGAKAMVAGTSQNDATCYWSWAKDTQNTATSSAVENCRKEFSDCALFATNRGLTPWAREISDNGGTSFSTLEQRREEEAANAAMADFLQAFSSGLQAARGGGNYTPSGSRGFSSPPRPSYSGTNGSSGYSSGAGPSRGAGAGGACSPGSTVVREVPPYC